MLTNIYLDFCNQKLNIQIYICMPNEWHTYYIFKRSYLSKHSLPARTIYLAVVNIILTKLSEYNSLLSVAQRDATARITAPNAGILPKKIIDKAPYYVSRNATLYWYENIANTTPENVKKYRILSLYNIECIHTLSRILSLRQGNVMVRNEVKGYNFCSATLISSQYVLTAASCLLRRGWVTMYI